MDSKNDLYLVGSTYSSYGIAAGGFQNTIGGISDAFILKITEQVPSSTIMGNIFNDINSNCIRDLGEKPAVGVIVKAEPKGYFSMTDTLGNFFIKTDTGKYNIKQILPKRIGFDIPSICAHSIDGYDLNIIYPGDTIKNIDFSNHVANCSYLLVNVTSNRRRPCFSSTTFVSYSNSGVINAENVKVLIKVQKGIVLLSADKSFTIDKDSNYVFNIGNLNINSKGTIHIKDSLLCNSSFNGSTLCTKALISSSNECQQSADKWDKSDLLLYGKCIENGRIKLVIKNTGFGNMIDSSQFRVFLDAKLALKKNFKLIKNDSLKFIVPANGKTLRLEADESPYHPEKSQTNLSIENCKSTTNEVASLGFVNQLPQDDSEHNISIDCQQIRLSKDPNDKQSIPLGTTSKHYTRTDSKLKYLIRFQNTGTDTAYIVTIIDTLDKNLDISTLKIGAVSHKYKFKLTGTSLPVLIWTFNNINLLDSNTNNLLSNGFVSFSINPYPNLPTKTLINNFSDIIFDYNYPVRTNITYNTLYDVPLIVDEEVRLDESILFQKDKPLPYISGIKPAYNYPGSVITISGKNYEPIFSDNTLTLNGQSVNIISGNDSLLSIIWPKKFQVGELIITTKAGKVNRNMNLFIAKPSITYITPQSANSIGTIIISGENYAPVFSDNTVTLDGKKVDVISGNTTSLTIPWPNNFKTGEVTVTTEGGTAKSNVDFVLGTENILNSSIKVYPNPTNGKFVIEHTDGVIKSIQVSDVLGKIIYKQIFKNNTQSSEINLVEANAGMYVIFIETDMGTTTKKLIIK